MIERQAVKELFIEPMTVAFAPPRHLKTAEQITAALREYADALHRFSREELESGWKRVRDSHQYRTWPSIAECVSACSEARKMRRPDGAGRQQDAPKPRAIEDDILSPDALRNVMGWVDQNNRRINAGLPLKPFDRVIGRCAETLIERHEKALRQTGRMS